MIKLKNKNVLVYGLGVSGIAAAKLLCSKGANVWAYDDKIKDCKELHGLPCVFLKSKKDIPYKILEFCVLSPGIKPFAMPIPVIGELELGSWFVKKPIVAVTGTNGKTTVVQMIANIFKTEAVGNVGKPICEGVKGTAICEVSSFQLETIKTFRPHIAVVLNITQDHLNRHKTMKEYARVKGRIFENQTKKDYAILNYDCETTRGYKPNSKVLYFSTKQKADLYCDGTNIIYKNKVLFKASELPLIGEHNLSNFLASILVAILSGYKIKHILQACKNFKLEHHRIEHVADINGVQFFNDSKATNIASTMAAVNSFPNKNLHLILGGQVKGQKFDNFVLPNNVKTVVVIGEAKEVPHFANSNKAESLEQAVQVCFANAQPSDIVLLSPACASFDMFKNYQHRGEVFKDACSRISERISEEEKNKAH